MCEDPGKKRFNLLRCPLNQQFHRSVREVSDITSDRKTLCKGLCGFPKVDSLNAAVENYFSGFEGGGGIFHGGWRIFGEKKSGYADSFKISFCAREIPRLRKCFLHRF